jgi:hypothetical protein
MTRKKRHPEPHLSVILNDAFGGGSGSITVVNYFITRWIDHSLDAEIHSQPVWQRPPNSA